MIRSSLGLSGILLALGTSAVVVACSSSTADTSTPAAVQSASSAVPGPVDSHCGGTFVKVNPAACTASDADAGADGGSGQGTDPNEFGKTMYGSSGNDDDCKYHVAWTSTPASVGASITFVVTATNLSDNTPTTGASPYIEAYLDERTPAANSNPQTTEGPPGTYTIGPIELSSPGQWTVRFHFFGTCNDSADSPHGHAAFYVAAP